MTEPARDIPPKKLMSQMSPKEQEQKLAEHAEASKVRAASGEKLITPVQPDLEEQKKLDEAYEEMMSGINKNSPASTTPAVTESPVTQRAKEQAQEEMHKLYGGRLSTIPKPQSEIPPLANPSEKWFPRIIRELKEKLGL